MELGSWSLLLVMELGSWSLSPVMELGPLSLSPVMELGPLSLSPVMELGPLSLSPVMEQSSLSLSPVMELGPLSLSPVMELGPLSLSPVMEPCVYTCVWFIYTLMSGWLANLDGFYSTSAYKSSCNRMVLEGPVGSTCSPEYIPESSVFFITDIPVVVFWKLSICFWKFRIIITVF